MPLRTMTAKFLHRVYGGRPFSFFYVFSLFTDEDIRLGSAGRHCYSMKTAKFLHRAHGG